MILSLTNSSNASTSDIEMPFFSISDPSPEPWDEWREKVDTKLKEVREMMKAHERACDAHNVSFLILEIFCPLASI